MLKFLRLTAAITTASLVLTTGCSSKKQPQLTAASSIPIATTVASSSEPSQTSLPSPQADSFQDALDAAESASNISQSTQSKDDWILVISKWQEAINLMRSVPQSSENYASAQKKVTEYQQKLTEARKQFVKTPAAPTSPPPLRLVVVQCGKEQIVLDETKGIADVKGPIFDVKDYAGAWGVPFPPFYNAIGQGCKPYVEFLISKGADVNQPYIAYWKATDRDLGLIKDLGNLSPLHLAWKKDIAALLIAKGANVNVTFKGGLTPLHVKAMFDSTQAAKEMQQKGMDIIAIKKEMVGVAELLIAKGANVNTKDDQGKTPLRLAKEMQFQEMVELLKSKGGKE